MPRGRHSARGTRRGRASDSQRAEDSSAIADPAEGIVETNAEPAQATTGSSSAAEVAPPVTPPVAPARRGGPAPKATRGPTSSRLRPRNIRRDEAERDTLARQEEQKASERVADEKRAQGRSRFRSKRSRGDTMNSRGGGGRPITTASGPFSAGPGRTGFGRPGLVSSGGGGGGGGFRGAGGSFQGLKSENRGGAAFSRIDDGQPREARINADRLHGMTPEEEADSDDEALRVAMISRADSVMPMGIYRKEHKEAEVVVATTAELAAAENATEEESLWVDGQGLDAQPLPDPPKEEGSWGQPVKNAPKIKQEPDTEDKMDVDLEDASMAEKEKPPGAGLRKRAVAQDAEDKMACADLEMLASELGGTTIAEDGDDASQGPSDKDGRMYLFQFPPLLPPLNQSAAPKSAKGTIKDEKPESALLDAPPASSDTGLVDLTQQGSGQANALTGAAAEDPKSSKGFMSELLSQGGRLGKLNVRKSGKAELDWGGCILELSPAAGMNFLTTAVIVEERDEKAQPGVVGGDSIGMGKIMGRFVLAPTWDEEDDWNVAPEELEFG